MVLNITKFEEKNYIRRKNNLERAPVSYARIPSSRNILKNAVGEVFLSFSCNDNFGFRGKIFNEAVQSVALKGVGAGAARTVTGNSFAYEELEKKLADHYKRDAAVVFGSGYLAGVSTLGYLFDRNDIVFADRDMHRSDIDGLALSRAKVYKFNHNDINHLRFLLENTPKTSGNIGIITETVFSMDGSLAPLNDICNLAAEFNAVVVVDNAHGIGILDIPQEVDVILGSMSKALGSYGGYVCAPKCIIQYLYNEAGSLLCSTALPECVILSAFYAFKLLSTEEEILRSALLRREQFFCKLVGKESSGSHINVFSFKDVSSAMQTSEFLKQRGFLVQCIRPPVSKEPILRFTFGIRHSFEEISLLAEALNESMSSSIQ